MNTEGGVPVHVDPSTEARLITARRKYESAKRAAVILLCMTLVALAGGLLAILLEVRRTSATIADCLTPGGECYEAAQRDDRVRDVNAANVVELCRRLKVDCQTPPPPKGTNR